MKRSEAIRKIERVLNDVRMESGYSRAERVLKIIEHEGMLPPAYNNKDSGINIDYPTHKWEDEDEKN